jgi:hypothetical protein
MKLRTFFAKGTKLIKTLSYSKGKGRKIQITKIRNEERRHHR